MNYFPLARFNAHTLSDVIQWINFADIMRLYCTGDNSIIRTLTQPGTIREVRIYDVHAARTIRFLNSFVLSIPELAHQITELDVSRHHGGWKQSEEHSNIMLRFSATIPSFDRLSRLILRHFPIQSDIILPNSLTHLVLCANNAPVINGHLAVRALPRGLLHLEMDDSSVSCTNSSVEYLPPGLTTLIQWEDALTNDAISLLPRSLTRLKLHDNNVINDVGINFLPPKLTHLNLSSNKLITDHAIPLLPRTLKLLDLDENRLISNDAIPFLPPGLTHLVLSRAKRITSHCFIFLPRSLTLLDIAKSEYLDETHIADLPRTLTYLDLDMCSHHLTDFGVPDLPRQLRYLDITTAGLITDACIPHLPPSLTKLFMISANITSDGALRLLETIGLCNISIPRHLTTNMCNKQEERAPDHTHVDRHFVWRFLMIAAAHVVVVLLAGNSLYSSYICSTLINTIRRVPPIQ